MGVTSVYDVWEFDSTITAWVTRPSPPEMAWATGVAITANRGVR